MLYALVSGSGMQNAVGNPLLTFSVNLRRALLFHVVLLSPNSPSPRCRCRKTVQWGWEKTQSRLGRLTDPFMSSINDFGFDKWRTELCAPPISFFFQRAQMRALHLAAEPLTLPIKKEKLRHPSKRRKNIVKIPSETKKKINLIISPQMTRAFFSSSHRCTFLAAAFFLCRFLTTHQKKNSTSASLGIIKLHRNEDVARDNLPERGEIRRATKVQKLTTSWAKQHTKKKRRKTGRHKIPEC